MNIALANAWRIARAHGHHWASSATPERLALGRALQLECGFRPTSFGHGAIVHRVLHELGLTAEQVYDTIDPGAIPPASDEEAAALDHLPRGGPGGISPPQACEDGSYGSSTGTGRATWTCYPDGRVEITVGRPDPHRGPSSSDGYPVLHAVIAADGAVVVTLDERERYGRRHRDALTTCVRAITERMWLNADGEPWVPIYDPDDPDAPTDAGDAPAGGE